MASRSLGVLTIDLIAKTGGFVAELDKAVRKSKGSMDAIEKSVKAASAALAGIAVAGAAGLAAMAVSTANSAREIQNLARVANATESEFQRITFAAKRFGIEQDKVADILKDTSDKIGDFITTGGGPMADFFEKVAPLVGVTAENFRKLSGPQALQLYVSSLERANLSQSEMTFFLEAIANDATLLLPLLRDNGRAMGELGDRAERLGVVLSDVEIANLIELDNQIEELQSTMKGLSNEIVIAILPNVQELFSTLQDPEVLEGIQTFAKGVVTAVGWIAEAIAVTSNVMREWSDDIVAMLQGPALGDIKRLGEELADVQRQIDRLEDPKRSGNLNVSQERRLKALKDERRELIEKLKISQQMLLDERKLGQETATTTTDIRRQGEAAGRTATALSQTSEKAQEVLNALAIQRAQLSMTGREQAIFNALLGAGAEASSEMREQIAELAGSIYDQEAAVRAAAEAQQDAEQAADDLRRANEQATQAMIRDWQNVRQSFGEFFADLVMEGGNAFDALLKSWERTALQMAGNSIFDMGAQAMGINIPGGTGSTSYGAFGSAINAFGGKYLVGLTKPGAVITDAELQQLLGGNSTGVGGLNMADITNIAKTLGAGIAGSFAGNLAGEGLFGKEAESQWASMIGGTAGAALGGPLGAFIGSALGSMVDVAFGGDGKQRINAGLLTAPTPGLKQEYNAGSHQFASGVKATLFARRADTQAARDILAVFDQVDRSYVELIEALGGKVAATHLTGLDEEATAGSTGAFFGVGGNGTTQGDIMAQAASWVQQLTNYTTGLDEALLENVRSAKSAEEALSLLAEAVAADELKNAWESIKDSMDPLRVKTRAYEADLEILGQIFVEGSQEFTEAADQLKVFHGLAKSAEELARAEKELADQRRKVQIEYMGWVRTETDSALKVLADSVKAETKIREEAHSRALEMIRADAEMRTQAYQLALGAAQEGLQSMRSEVQGVSSALASLRSVFAPDQVRAQALAMLRSSLTTGDFEGVGPASSIAAQLDANNFASAEEFRLEQARTLALLGAVEREGKQQIDFAEQAVVRLEEQIELTKRQAEATEQAERDRFAAEIALLESELSQAQEQVSLLRGIESGVLSLSGALSNFTAAIGREATARASSSQSIPYSGSDITAYYQNLINSGSSATDAAAAVRNRAIAEGYTSGDVAGALGWSDKQMEDFLHSVGVPGFASGGSHAGGWRIVGENGPELEYTGPSRIFSNAASKRLLEGDGDIGVIAELREVNARLAKIEAYTDATARASVQHYQLDDRIWREEQAEAEA